jgi:hypothetical protein
VRGPLAVVAILAAVIRLASPAGALADGPVVTIDWTVTPPASGTVVDGAARVTAGSGGGSFPLAAIEGPDLGTTGYEIRGLVRYTDVASTAYLEMWSAFQDGSRYFSRTLATEGPMMALSGSSDWRPFELRFDLNGGNPPNRLEINLVLPGAGSVDVGRLELVALPAGESSDGAWLPGPSVGIVGGIAGGAIGMFGALIGVLVSRRRGRAFVVPAMTVAAITGVALNLAGGVALVAGQPSSVVYLFALTGAILALAFGLQGPRVRRLYADAELRRMRALDHG